MTLLSKGNFEVYFYRIGMKKAGFYICFGEDPITGVNFISEAEVRVYSKRLEEINNSVNSFIVPSIFIKIAK